MAFDGSGVFLRIYSWVVDATAGTKIRADRHDDEDNNFALGLSQCIVKDGQTTITQNIPWNSKRITALQDPVDAQDAATKAYADTKVAKTGDGTVTGNLTVTGNIDAGGTVSAHGYKVRKGLPGPYGTNFFNFDWTGNLEAWVDNTNLGALATQAYANSQDAAVQAALQAQINTKQPALGFTPVQQGGGSGMAGNKVYIGWSGAGLLAQVDGVALGAISFGAGQITSLQLIFAGSHNHTSEGQSDPFAGGLACGFGFPAAFPDRTLIVRYRYLQAYANGGWWTVGYVG